ncbi:unnamed protein product [Callosobruchus maculatus]|uniref:HMG box domain-containing protein n=1 Tax=Callosobruchus maculatus TaxID=64391 RepID=A0A653BTG5_CALMS|nr:unnamed protein product [Callosobruchus maculatus]
MARRKSRGCKTSKKAHRRRSKRRSKGCGRKGKRCKEGRKTINPFLNFLRVFRKQHCDWPVKKVAIEGAKCWCKMSPEQKRKYYKQACKQQQKEMKCREGPKGKKRYSRSCSRAGLNKCRSRSKSGRRKRKGKRSRSRGKKKGRSRSKKIRSKCGKRGRSKGRRSGRSRRKKGRSRKKSRGRSRSRKSSRRASRRRSRRSGSRRGKKGDSCKAVSGPGIFSTILEKGNSVSVVIDPDKGITFKG